MALKFIVDDYRSNNLFAASSVKESDSWNFFENDMSNQLAPLDPEEDEIIINTY